ncbi:MAG TPA: SHOCT domain-containing protein [Candidatus Limnocylindrales bacterium]|nr:SHOCT domain-containing protein [Candidatus Limnocylindrales bacterium]
MMAGWTMGLDAWIWMGVWVVALVATVWLLAREPSRSPHETPLEALRGRLARGEITPDEFEQARRLLES